MDKLINFTIKLMERENMYSGDSNLLPSQNPTINPSQNPDINTSQNPEINSTQNPKINWSQTPNWKKNQWKLFKETVLWEYLNDSQKEKCKQFLRLL